MNFKDKWATDEEGNQFLFTVEMQRQLSEQGLEIAPESLKQLKTVVKPAHAAVSAPSHTSQAVNNQDAPAPSQQSQTATKEEPIDFDVPLTIQIDPATGKYIGRMKWYNAKKGYGFIVRGAGEEIFFHKSSIMGEPEALSEGQWILYDIEDTRKGPEAAEVEPYEGDISLLS